MPLRSTVATCYMPGVENVTDMTQRDASSSAASKKPKNSLPAVLIALHILLLIYSFSGIFSKNAAHEPFLSLQFCLLYFGMLCMLGIYAIGWQQILKRMPLTVAFANKAVTIIWGMLWGVLFFGEVITWPMIVGAVIVMAGVVLYSYADKEDQQKANGDGPLGVDEEQL